MRGIKILDPGMYTSIQDSGRKGYREYGLPSSGAMDINSLHLANWLVKNDMNEGVIETIFHGLEIEFLSSLNFSISGGDMSPELNGQKISNWKTYKAKAGDRLALTRMKSGARSYIAISGGFRIDHQLGSMSTYAPGKIGGYRGRKLIKDDTIPIFPGLPFLLGKRKVPDDLIPVYKHENIIRVVSGVNIQLFDKSTIDSFFDSEFQVTAQSDRMGLRLDGPDIHPKNKGELISLGIHPGTIQIPGSGKPIIMGADCQTIGGYPQIVNIISADIPLSGQLRPGDKIRFTLIDQDEALSILKDYYLRIDNLFSRRKTPVCNDCISKKY